MLIHIVVDSAETRRPRPWPQGVPGTSSHVTFRCFARFVRDVAAFAFDICLYLSLGDYIRIITDIYIYIHIWLSLTRFSDFGICF